MAERGKVSVIIPAHNGEKFLKRAIETALYQTIPPLEVIVVDDASTDRTREVVGSIKDPRIRYLRNDVNRERAYTRNRGVEVARGDFIFFLDYDDEWKEDYLESSLEYLEGGYDVVYSFPREFIDGNGKVIRVSRKPLPKDTGTIIFSSLIGYPSATSMRKEIFTGYRDEYIPREDWELFIRSFLEGRSIKVLDNRKVLIREHGGRTSRSLKFMHSTLKLYKDYKDEVPEEYLPQLTLHTALICLRFGNLPRGWSLFFKSIARKPSLLKNSRNLINVLKWGLRIDRFFNYLQRPSPRT